MSRLQPAFEPLNYREASERARRVLLSRASVATAVRRLRHFRKLTQRQVAMLAISTQDRIPKLERVYVGVTLDFAVHVLIVLDASDDEIARAFDPRTSTMVRSTRNRSQDAFYPKPAPPTKRDYKGRAASAIQQPVHEFGGRRSRGCVHVHPWPHGRSAMQT